MKSIHQERYKDILSRLIQARKEAKITQQELAKALNKPQSYVSKYEIGERRLDVVELLAITEALGIDYKDVIDHS